jgi:hypothetical protein
MVNVSQTEPYVPRVDRIIAGMEANWQKYGFRGVQEMLDWYFGFTRKFLGVILGQQEDNLGVMNIQKAEDMLRLYPLEKFRKDSK